MPGLFFLGSYSGLHVVRLRDLKPTGSPSAPPKKHRSMNTLTILKVHFLLHLTQNEGWQPSLSLPGVHLCTSLEFAMETFEHDDMFFLQKTNLQCPVAPTLGVFFGTVHCGITWLSWMTGV